MTDEKHNYLLEAVESLTNPIRNKIVQDGPIGSGLAGTQVVTVELPPLLTQLDTAIRGTVGIGGSGAIASQRNMLDGDALHRFMMISSTIKDWARMVKAPITGDAAGTLMSWFARYEDRTADSSGERFYIRQMTGWKASILAKLDPPKVWEQPGACPVCGAETWWSKSTHEEYKFPLIVEYHQTGPNLIQEARALCRACEQVWTVRQLAYELEQAELAKAIAAEATA